jgi:hypothetical protein
MRHNVVDIGNTKTVCLERFEHRFGQDAHSKFVYLTAVHCDLVHVLGQNFLAWWELAASARNRQYTRGAPIGVKMR